MKDFLLLNGNILTMDGGRAATAVAFHQGRISHLGDSTTLRSDARPGVTIVDLAGRTVVPAFTDAHAHVWKMGHLLTTMLDLRQTPSLDSLAKSVATRDTQLPEGEWLLGRGFNEVNMREKRKPSRHDLDRAAPNRPVVLTHTSGHIYAANSAALRVAGITSMTPQPPGGVIEHDQNGEPNGLLHETAMGLINRVLPPHTASNYEQMILAALRHQLSLGITASADCGVIPELLNVYRDMDARGALPARMLVMPLRRVDGRKDTVPLPEQYISDMLRVDTVKFLADGGLSGATAALSVPYRHSDSRGTLRFGKEDLQLLCQESHDQGWRIATHAIGDVTIDLVLSVYESLGPHPKGLAHRIEHLGLPDSAQLRRAARMGVIAVPQTIFLHELGGNFLAMTPDALLPRTYPVRSMLDSGLTVALSSDAPVVEDDNPLMGMYAAITRRTKDGRLICPEQGITAAEALYAYTMGGAIASGEANTRGSITPGKWADVAVLSANPLTAETEALPEVRVDMTFLAGNIVYER
jgi:predicted amidohydrolase YtcJ